MTHRLDRRAALLGQKLRERITNSVAVLRGEGAPPFTKQMPRSEAAAWWRKNWDTPVGKEAYGRLTPEQQMDLQAELARRVDTTF